MSDGAPDPHGVMRRHEPAAAARWLVPAVLGVSGAAALVYQVAWIRLASLAFGSTTEAVGLVVAVFFLGLAVGSHTFGRLSQRTARPLRLFGQVEIALALVAAPSPWAFALADAAYGHLFRALGGGGVRLQVAHGLLLALVVLPPTILMGAALPLCARWLVRTAEGVARPVARAYAWNTLGATVGASATGFALLPLVGVRSAVLLAAAAQAVVGLVLLAARLPGIQDAEAPRLAAPPGARRTSLAALFFLSGFSALALEVIWTRYLSLILQNTIHTYTLTLTVVLFGIVLGAALAGQVFDRRLPLARVYGAIQLLVALCAVLLLELPPPFWKSLGGAIPTCAVLLLPAAVLSGASFPLAARMAIDAPERAGARVGWLAAVNTLGGILGALLAGYTLLPRLGLETSARVVGGVSLLAAAAAWLFLDDGLVLRRRMAHVVAATVLFGVATVVPGARVPQDFLAQGRELLAHREGREGNLAVLREADGTRVLEIDRWWQGQDRKTHQVLAAHLPMLLHPDPRRVLCVGVGAGQTPSRFLMYDVERVDCVDIEPALFDLVRQHFGGAWLDDPRVRLVHADGRSLLAHSAEQWDVISLEIGQTFRPGAAGFYTADLYGRARERLEPGGLLVQFVPLAFLTPETLHGVVRTFLEVFPRSLLWYNTSELLLVGVAGERFPFDGSRLELLSTRPAVHEDLRWAHWGGRDLWLNDAAVLLGGFLAGPQGLAGLSRGGPIYRDDRPVLEYAMVAATEMRPREMDLLPLLRASLDPVEQVLGVALDPAVLARVRQTREGNLRDIAAGALLRTLDFDDPQFLPDLLQAALEHNPDNLRVRRMLGDTLYVRGDLDGARDAYLRLLGQGHPAEEALAHRGLGLLLSGEGRHAEAAEHYRAALAATPQDHELHNMLGAALGLGGDLEGAVEHFGEALRLKPDYENARRNLEQTLAARARAGG